MNCVKCSNTGYVEIFSCCKGFEDLINNKCCGIPYSTKDICKCGLIKLYQIIYMHSNDEEESEIYINAKSEKEAKIKYYSLIENGESQEDSCFSSICEI